MFHESRERLLQYRFVRVGGLLLLRGLGVVLQCHSEFFGVCSRALRKCFDLTEAWGRSIHLLVSESPVMCDEVTCGGRVSLLELL